MDPIWLSSLHDFEFSHNRLYPTMVVKNVEYGFTSQKTESRHFYSPQGNLFLPSPYHHPRTETNYSFAPVEGEDYENLFQNVLL